MSAAGIDNRGTSTADHDPFATPIARIVPSTDAQREIWLATQLGTQASLAFNESVSLLLQGAVDADALQRALTALGMRHDALRASLSADGMHLLFAPYAELPLQVTDLQALPAEARADACATLRTQAVTIPFELTTAPLLRATLAWLGADQAELILSAHHIVCDGWSFGVLVADLMHLYHHECTLGTGAVAALPAAERFADFAAAQQAAPARALAESDCRYWLARHAVAAAPLALPTDRARPSRRSFDAARTDLLLESSLASALKRWGARHRCSLHTTLLAPFAALLGHLAGTDDLVIGVAAAGQAATGASGLVGHCVSLLPVRMQIALDTPVETLLAQTRSVMLDAFEHQSCTLGTLLHSLQLPRDPSRLPLTSVLFNLDIAVPGTTLDGAGLAVALRTNARAFENFDLFLNIIQNNNGLQLELQFNTTLFDCATVQRWLAAYQAMLTRMVETDDLTLRQALAPAAGEQRQLAQFCQGRQLNLPTLTVDALIAAQARQHGKRTALWQSGSGSDHASDDNHTTIGARNSACANSNASTGPGTSTSTSISYAELERQVDQVAQWLSRRGIGGGQRVGLCVQRGPAMVAALLGIMRSGAAYVPLDPAYPVERLAWMAADAGLALLVHDGSAPHLDWPNAATAAIDTVLAETGTTVMATDASGAGPDDPAYVIYTSGSTGTPKGVVVPHRAVVNFLLSMQQQPGISADDRLLAVTTLSFDIAVLELLLPLTVGATVVLASHAQARDAQALTALLDTSAATMMQATPSTWQMLLAAGWQARPGFTALVGGEALGLDLAQRLLANGVTLWNMYGPTETTVWSTCWPLPTALAGIRIGSPIANTSVHVLDASNRPCPLGSVGELWIGGAGVALGYLHQPELTAARFIADPFDSRPGARLYRTGDLGRWRADGLLEHLGRNDDQVKLRGYRIELGEVEVALSAHPAVAHGVALVREDTPGDARLLAWVVPHKTGAAVEAAVDVAELRIWLATRLPAYMLPQQILVLAALPLLPNGKVDRAALPALQAVPLAAMPVAPTLTPTEAMLAALWQRLLKVDCVAPEDNFFDLGGHSLLVMQAVAAMEADTGKRMQARNFIFETLRQIAAGYDALGVPPAPQPGMLRRLLGGLTGRRTP